MRCIVAGTSGLLPFIIWGPPGTGKTSTLVEAAAQVGVAHGPGSAATVDPSTKCRSHNRRCTVSAGDDLRNLNL